MAEETASLGGIRAKGSYPVDPGWSHVSIVVFAKLGNPTASR